MWILHELILYLRISYNALSTLLLSWWLVSAIISHIGHRSNGKRPKTNQFRSSAFPRFEIRLWRTCCYDIYKFCCLEIQTTLKRFKALGLITSEWVIAIIRYFTLNNKNLHLCCLKKKIFLSCTYFIQCTLIICLFDKF